MPENINKFEESLNPSENTREIGGYKIELPADADLRPIVEVGEKVGKDETVTAGDLANFKESLERARKFKYDGLEFTPEEYKTLVAPNIKIWEEIKRGDYSHHDQLTYLIPEVTAELVRINKGSFNLDNLTTLDPATAAELAEAISSGVHLDGLKNIDEPTAAELGKCKCDFLSLDGLTTLDLECAKRLASYMGFLSLDGIISLDPAVIKELAQCPAYIRFKDLDKKSTELYNLACGEHHA